MTIIHARQRSVEGASCCLCSNSQHAHAHAHANRWHAHSGCSLKPVLVTPAFLPCRRRLLVMVSNSLMSMVLSSLESNISKIILTSCRAQSWCCHCWWQTCQRPCLHPAEQTHGAVIVEVKHLNNHPNTLQSNQGKLQFVTLALVMMTPSFTITTITM